jgi:hypothetical protein
MTFHISEAELARDIEGVLKRVRQGDEFVVEHDRRIIAVIKAPAEARGRSISESISIAKSREKELGYSPVPDPEFSRDVEAAIDFRRAEPFNPPRWD